MAERSTRSRGVPGRRPPRRAGRYVMRAIVIAYLFLLVAWPVSLVAKNAFADGLTDIQAILDDPDVVHALRLTVFVAIVAVVINTVFGVGMSILLVRYRFPGRRALNALVDLPLSVSPIVVGLSLVLVYGGRDGWLGPGLEDAGFQVIYATPGIVLATVFVALPLVVREVVPVLEEVGIEQEQAAWSLGANAVQTFRRITLPSIRWAVVYGVVLSLARSLGEFGAVKVVSGNVLGETRTATLVVEEKYLNFDKGGAYATAFLLALVSVACIVVVSFVRPKEDAVVSIEVSHVGKRFGDFVALDDVTVSIPTGQLTALLGPSGGGKSTLLRIIAGLDQADEGVVEIEGTDATYLPPQKRNVGFVFQHYAAFKHMTVRRNVSFGLEIRRRPKDEVRRRVDELLELVHLEQFADRLPSQLSGGQRQRMALARALAVEPTVLLLDEPFGALDAKVRKELRDWLRRLHDEVRVTTVFVTHDQEEALEVADEIVVINEGRIEQIGSPDELYDAPANEFVMRFLGPVTQLGPDLVRPHDVELLAGDPGDGVAGTVSRVVRVGFEVRVEVATADQVVLVTMTRTQFQALGLEVGTPAWLRPVRGAPTVVALGGPVDGDEQLVAP